MLHLKAKVPLLPVIQSLVLSSVGPSKPSFAPDPPSLQPESSSPGPWSSGLLSRSALSLGSGPRPAASSKSGKGFDRRSAAGGILDQLQMPNRLGLKFPNRNFGREQSAKPASPVLAPLPSPPATASMPVTSSPPVTSSLLVNPPSPPPTLQTAVDTDPAAKDTASPGPAERQSPVEVQNREQAIEFASEMDAVPVSEPEPKRRLQSRFTEEHLTPLLPQRRAESTRALPSSPSPQTDTATAASTQAAVTVQKQASTVGQPVVDPHMPLQGFRRHVSLRDPMVGIEQLAAIVASRQVRHEPAGPSDDDIMASAQAAAIARRRASADWLNVMPESSPVIIQSARETAAQQWVADAEIETPPMPLAEPDTECAGAATTETAYEDDFQVESVPAADEIAQQPEALDRAAEAEAAAATDVTEAAAEFGAEPAAEIADSTSHVDPNSGMAAQADGQTEAVQQSDALLVADVDGVVQQLNDVTVAAALGEQDENVGKIASLNFVS